ncbi:unnamed protein product [Acanthoscelides obtectus]|uniref:Uncharacterized protein n=1 Tax=Acanthoscelides obtectus TaxID=200917 RepID=A0A9P0L5Y3_ACAOB|nr:unnamed protein product [Acanthoscelides obtectus]CAK1646876.1 hypothetical protein AOBTE_LOCUS14910 [Acanthoscelides obtectus]
MMFRILKLKMLSVCFIYIGSQNRQKDGSDAVYVNPGHTVLVRESMMTMQKRFTAWTNLLKIATVFLCRQNDSIDFQMILYLKHLLHNPHKMKNLESRRRNAEAMKFIL